MTDQPDQTSLRAREKLVDFSGKAQHPLPHTQTMQGRQHTTISRARYNPQPLLASEDILILFVADIAQTRTYSTIKAHLAGVGHVHIINNHGSPHENKLKLDLILIGIR